MEERMKSNLIKMKATSYFAAGFGIHKRAYSIHTISYSIEKFYGFITSQGRRREQKENNQP